MEREFHFKVAAEFLTDPDDLDEATTATAHFLPDFRVRFFLE